MQYLLRLSHLIIPFFLYIQFTRTIENSDTDDESDYGESYTVNRIVTISGKKNEMSFVAQLNNGAYGLIAGSVAKKEFPQKVIEFYESKIRFFDRALYN